MVRWVLIIVVLGGLTCAGMTWTSALWKTEAITPFDPTSVPKRAKQIEIINRQGVRVSIPEGGRPIRCKYPSGMNGVLVLEPGMEPPPGFTDIVDISVEEFVNQPPEMPTMPPGSRAFRLTTPDGTRRTTILPPGKSPQEGWVEIPLDQADMRKPSTRDEAVRYGLGLKFEPSGAKPPPGELSHEAAKGMSDKMAAMTGTGFRALVVQPITPTEFDARGKPIEAPKPANAPAVDGLGKAALAAPGADAKAARIGRAVRGLDRHVGTKPVMPEPDLGPAITLQVPLKPSDPLEAFYYKHTVGEFMRLRAARAYERDQRALDLFAAWSRARADVIDVSASDLCLMWHSVPWRQPLADHIYERNERSLLPDSQMLLMTGLRFTGTTESLRKAGYSPYIQMLGNIAAAREILAFFPDEKAGQSEAKKFLDRALALLPAVLEDPDLSAEALLSEMDTLCHVHEILNKDSEPAMTEILETVRKKRPEMLPLLKGNVMVKLAWQARGGGYANTITEEGGRLFALRLKKARESLTEAWEKNPNVWVAMEMMSVCLGQSDVRGHEVWYNRAISLQPDSSSARSRRMPALCRKWFGSDADMFAFARECVERYRKDPALNYSSALLICSAHQEAGVGEGDVVAYLARKDVYAEIKGVLLMILERNPQRLDVWSRLAYYADEVSDFAMANAAFEAIEKVGNGLGCTTGFASEQHYQSARDRALARAGKK